MWTLYYFEIDDTKQSLIDNTCQEYNDSSHNTYSYRSRQNKYVGKKNYPSFCDGTAYIGVYLSYRKKADPVELAKKLEQKEADETSL